MLETVGTFRAWVSNQMSEYDASHDIVHVDNVVHHATTILKENSCSENSNLYMATILCSLAHDICDRKYVTNVTNKLNSISLILSRLHVNENVVKIVEKVIPRISFSKRLKDGEPLDLSNDELFVYKVVSDADMLESMGATGVVRTYMFQAVHGHTAKGAWIHTTDTLFRCMDYLVFPYSINEGKIRLERMKRICLELENERKFM